MLTSVNPDDPDDRRTSLRRHCFLSADIRQPDQSPVVVVVTDLSATGLSVALPYATTQGDVILLTPRSVGQEDVRLYARVVWVQMQHGIYWTGCQLETPLSESQADELAAATLIAAETA